MSAARIALIGSGVIGRGWAVVFARAGHEVALYDVRASAVETGLEQIGAVLEAMAAHGLVADPAAALGRIRCCANLAEAAEGAALIQESVPEDLAAKRAVLTDIDRLAAPEAIVASSCSSLDPGRLFDGLAGAGRCLVAHPSNPPYLLPLVELVAGPRTSPAAVRRCLELMSLAGQRPVVLGKAPAGYVVNRLQAAVINEAMHLVATGVIAPEDLDLCMTEGLGRRWAFMGPFETMDTNADEGLAGYARRYAASYAEVGRDLHVADPWTAEAIEQVVRMRRAALAAPLLAARRAWRDERLMDMLAEADPAQAPPATPSAKAAR